MKTKKEEVIVEAIPDYTNDGEVAYSYPQRILEYTIFAGKELVVRPVEKLAYKYEGIKFQDICHEHQLTKEEYEKVRDLVFLNSGYITPFLFRRHLKRGYGLCARLCESLIENGQAALRQEGTPSYSLPLEKRSGFM
jgi:hypothetical protein